MTSTRQLRCPSCDGRMQEVDRRGVRIDICTECRGVFLDRGELDKLLDLAPTDEANPAVDTTPTRPADRANEHDGDWSDERDREWTDERDRDWEKGRGRRRRRGGWLDDILDFG